MPYLAVQVHQPLAGGEVQPHGCARECSGIATVLCSWINILLVFVPLGIYSHMQEWSLGWSWVTILGIKYDQKKMFIQKFRIEFTIWNWHIQKYQHIKRCSIQCLFHGIPAAFKLKNNGFPNIFVPKECGGAFFLQLCGHCTFSSHPWSLHRMFGRPYWADASRPELLAWFITIYTNIFKLM